MESAAHAERVGLGGQRRVEEDAEQGALHARLDERLEDPDRVAAPATAGLSATSAKSSAGRVASRPQASAIAVASSSEVRFGT